MAKMALQKELGEIIRDEEQLVFPNFSHTTAYEIGIALYEKAKQKKASVAIDIRKGKHILFHLAMEGTSPNNDRWVERKSNAVQLMHKSSYRIGRELSLEGETLENRQALDQKDFASHGGSFPIRVEGVGMIGAVSVSGLPEKEDHALVVEVLKEYLKI